jgi:lipoprotein-releasing system permease protein
LVRRAAPVFLTRSMRRPVFLFVGLRYLRASRGSGFVSFVTVASVLGVALGVATLIVVLSVMNGFETELRDRLLGLTSHAAVIADEPRRDWEMLTTALPAQPGIVGAAPYVELEAMLSGAGAMTAGLVTGVEPRLEAGVSRVADSMVSGALSDLKPLGRGIVLGRALAQKLGVAPGDRVTVLVPRPPRNGGGVGSVTDSFTVVGIFELGVQDHDSVRAMLYLDDAAALGGLAGAVTGVRVETDDIFSAPRVVRDAVTAISAGGRYTVRDWTQENASYFRAIRIEKIMMMLLLSLIIGVAAFNIVAMLVMVVTEKRGGIAILRTLGCSRGDIVAVFVLQGTLIGWAGALLGLVLGVWMALNVDTLAPALETLFGFSFMPADLYYLTELPTELQWGDVLGTSVIVLLVTAVATVYPAVRAASVQPAEVLRYE